MTVENADYIHQLDPNNPASSDFMSEGDDHVRGVKKAIKGTFPNVAGRLEVTHVELNLLSGLEGEPIKTQLAKKASRTGDTYTGTHNFSDAELVLPGGVTNEKLAFLGTVTADVQEQIDSKAAKAGDTYTGTHNFTGATATFATPPAGDSSKKPATTEFVASVALSSALPGQTGNANKTISTNGSAAGWVEPYFPLASPDSMTVARTNGQITGATALVDGDTATTTLSRTNGAISGAVVAFRGGTTSIALNRDSGGLVTSVGVTKT